jgi:hypothetical protein
VAFAQDTLRTLQRSRAFEAIVVMAAENGVPAVRAITGTAPGAVVMADLPAAIPAQFDIAAERAAAHRISIAPLRPRRRRRHMSKMARPHVFWPFHGLRSRMTHVARGCMEIDVTGPDGVRRVVDTIERPSANLHKPGH